MFIMNARTVLVVLGISQSVFGWGFLTPRSVVEGGHIQFELINPDGGGYNFPYTFTIFQNSTGQDQQVNLQYVTATPFFWDNNQPIGRFLKFHVQDVNGFVSTTDYIPVSPNPTFVSSMSVQSTASLVSLQSTPTQNTSTSPPTSTPTGNQTSIATPGPVKTNVGAIAGGVVGGVLVLVAIIFGILLCLRRRRQNDNSSEKIDLDVPIPHSTVTPFTYNSNTNTHSYGGTLSQSGPTSYGTGPSSYAPSSAGGYTGQHDAPPIYSPPPPSEAEGSQVPTTTRGFSQRKGAYAPVSMVPH